MRSRTRCRLLAIAAWVAFGAHPCPGAVETHLRTAAQIRSLNSGRHLLSLINDVLDISKIEANQVELLIEPFPLRESIARACQRVSPLAPPRLPVEQAAALEFS